MIQNKGTGAGGANTNANGKKFEEKTSNEPYLLANGYKRVAFSKNKYDYMLEKTLEDGRKIMFFTQTGLKNYCNPKFGTQLFRKPDEAYLIQKGDSYTLKILEKKDQNGPGSVDTKLLAGPGFIAEYKYLLGPKFQVEYAFCVSSFLQNKYQTESPEAKSLRQYLQEHNIPLLFGDAEDYFMKLNQWLMRS